MKPRITAVAAALLLLLGLSLLPDLSRAQKLDNVNRDLARNMLRTLYDAVKKKYYDPAFHGVDIDAVFKKEDLKIQNAPTLDDAFTAIAAFLEAFHDSHLYYYPPGRTETVNYNFEMTMVGDHCFITALRPGSDAAAKLHIGDEVLSAGGFIPRRQELWKILYYYKLLSPRLGLTFQVKSPNGQVLVVEVAGKIHQRKAYEDLDSADIFEYLRSFETELKLGETRIVKWDKVAVMKFPTFDHDERYVDRGWDDVRGEEAVILDLRGNGGGAIKVLRRMASNLFPDDVTLFQSVERKQKKDEVAKSTHNPFKGKLFVLVDSDSASSSEMLARLVQLKGRGVVIGDRTAGAVRVAEPQSFGMGAGMGNDIFFIASITIADVIMPDGQDLEGKGVTPNVLLLPTQEDLVAGRDPVLSQAAHLAGFNLTPEIAGKLFPKEWPPE